jgi:hypothetical protein
VDIKFRNEAHEIIKIVPQFVSSNWQIKLLDHGDFLGDFGQNEALFKLLKDNDFVYAEQDSKQAIITGLEYTDKLRVYGRSLNYIMEKMKPITPQTWTNTSIETIARAIATQAFTNVSDFQLGTLKNVNTSVTFAVTDLEKPSECLKRLLENYNLGYKVYVSGEKWKFELVTSQSKNLVLSEALKNAYNMAYSENVDKYASHSLVSDGQGGFTEIAKDSKTGIKKWYDLSKDLSELKTSIKEKKIETKTRKIKYGIDYVLGDILRIKKDNEEYQKIISEVIFWYENNNIGEQPILSEVIS